MNISGIKKNKFWISIGIGMIFVIAFHFCVLSPFRSGKTGKMESLERLLTRLEMNVKKGHKIRNGKWIEAEEAKLEAIKKVQREYELFYKEQDSHLEKVFASVNGEEIKDEALWENRYIQGINVLRDEIKRREVSLGENALPFKQWKVEIPTWKEIVPEQKRFWVTEELVNIILNEELRVDYLEGINSEMENAVSANARTEFYDIIPFTIKVSMNVESLLILINELLKSKLSFEIKTINFSGELSRFRALEEVGKSFSSGQSVQKRSIRSPSIVDVVIDAYVLDFKI